ncbi:alkaline phosphatase [Halomonas sp. PR-M31]|uniref:alkaline phosphatase n=1 Tax=Halomonas sp. PR-M31 TaxID=1471202 RepID=UPI001C1230B0|nr:alkaline phosphatase [Halomonas sp. PR-M31]
MELTFMPNSIKHLTLIAIMMISSISFSQAAEKVEKPEVLARHVILIGSDGMGAYAFEKAKVPHLRKMMKEGAYSLKARSVLPSSSAVNWASMLMGSDPVLHGYTEWGSETPEIPSRVVGETGIFPTIFSLLEKQRPDAKKGVSYTWEGIGYLFEKPWVDLDYNGYSEESTLENALEFIVDEKPALTFIHFNEPDSIGHEIGHDTPEYFEKVEMIDGLVGKLLDALKESKMMQDTVIIFTADHGGIGKGHGGQTLTEMEIPWIIYGKNVPARGKLEFPIITYDTGATIAYILGLETPDVWRGKPVTEAFEKDEN